MPRFRRVVVAACAVAALAAPSPASAARPIETGVFDPHPHWARTTPWIGVAPELAFDRVRWGASGRVVRLQLYWRDVAPSEPPTAACDPSDAAYTGWAAFDRVVIAAAARRLDVIFSVSAAPNWAETKPRHWRARPGSWKPDPVAFRDFACAAATRYSGSFDPTDDGVANPLPRVRYWQAWNEANRSYFLSPQCQEDEAKPADMNGDGVWDSSDDRAWGAKLWFCDAGDAPIGIDWYRDLVTAFAAGVRSCSETVTTACVNVIPSGLRNRVVSSGLAPFANGYGPAPLAVMRRLFCLDGSCPAQRVPIEIWAHHPYTHGPPTESRYAVNRDDVALGDLRRMNRYLTYVWKQGRIAAPSRPAFWVTEWNWDSNAPDIKAVPMKLHARWVSEAIYRMWRAGVSLAVWTQLRDYPPLYRHPNGTVYTYAYQGGLYSYAGARHADDVALGPGGASDRPKLSLRAFRFPFVAFRRGYTVTVWGRVPRAAKGTRYRSGYVRVQRRTARGRWRTVARVRINRHGVFGRRFKNPMKRYAYMRAVLPGDASVAFRLKRPRWVEPEGFNLFGCNYRDRDGEDGPIAPDCPWPY